MKHNRVPSSCSKCRWPSKEAMLPQSWGPLGDFHYFVFSCSRSYIGHYILLEHMYIYLSVTYFLYHFNIYRYICNNNNNNIRRLWFKAYLEEALRDRLVCGLLSETIQRALLAEADLTLQRAFEVAQSMETAHKNAQSLKGTKVPVYKVDQSDHAVCGSGHSTSSSEPAGEKVCYRCGRTGYLPRDCRFKDTTCQTCGKGATSL